MKQYNQFFVTCSKGVEDLVQRELEQLGISDTKIHTGGVSFSGDIDDFIARSQIPKNTGVGYD